MKRSASVWPAIVIAIALVAGVVPGCAQDYPSRPITVIVPFPPGGASDVVARIVTNEMSRTLGQSFIIENVGGAGGTIGSARAAAATPDGYTLLAAAMGSHVAAPVLTPNVKYDPVVDFVPIGITAHSPAVVIARKDFPAQDLKEFIAVLRQRGDALKEAHGGTGASPPRPSATRRRSTVLSVPKWRAGRRFSRRPVRRNNAMDAGHAGTMR